MTTKISIIIGPPGTGKTTTLGTWVARAAQRYGHDRVIVCSLTRTAAHQAARQVELPFQQFGTVHAFAYRALGQPIVAEAKIKEWNDVHPANMSLSGAGQAKTPDDGFAAPDGATETDKTKLDYAKLRTQRVPRGTGLWLTARVGGFAKQWEDWKKQCGYVDFTDMLEQAIADVDAAPGEPAVIVGDEWQDVGALEMQLIDKWSKKAEHLVLAGDFLQSLFSFRGTDPMLLQMLWQAHDADRKPLRQSYRLPQSVYDYCQHWQKRFQQMMRVEFDPRRNVEGKIAQGKLISTGLPYNRYTSDSLEQLVDDHTRDGQSLMFITTCGYMLEPLMARLRDAGIPFANPWRPSNGKWNPLPQGRSRGHTIIDRVLAFTRPSVHLWGTDARFWTAADLKAWTGGLPVTNVFQRGMQAKLKELRDDASDEAISDLLPLCFTEEALKHVVPQQDMSWYLTMVKGSDVLRDYVVEVTQRRGVRTLQRRPLVTVGTVHSLKGAEADTVVLFPDISLEASTAAHQHTEAAEELRRVFYVGITRAKNTLILAQAASQNAIRW